MILIIALFIIIYSYCAFASIVGFVQYCIILLGLLLEVPASLACFCTAVIRIGIVLIKTDFVALRTFDPHWRRPWVSEVGLWKLEPK